MHEMEHAIVSSVDTMQSINITNFSEGTVVCKVWLWEQETEST